MEISFLTAEAGAVAALVLAPLAALAVAARRGARVRRLLRLDPPRRRSAVAPAAALVGVGLLLGLAAAQPVLSAVNQRDVRADAEAFLVLDTSRSMLAAPGPQGPTRMQRAKTLALQLREVLNDVPVGVASLTDRALPHVFPTANSDAFEATLDRALDVERPPPVNIAERATDLDALYEVGTSNFFRAEMRRKLVVVLTDGETQAVDLVALQRALPRGEGFRLFLVHVWGGAEQIFRRGGGVEAQYAPDPASVRALDVLAEALRGEVFDESEVDALTRSLRSALGDGPTEARTERERRLVLAPYAVLAALPFLGLLLWSRNRA